MEEIQFVPTTKNNIIALMGESKSQPQSHPQQENDKEKFADLEEISYYPPRSKKNIDPIFHYYLGSMSVVGLFILFRMIQKN